jgi:serine/threonine-protein kinase
MAIVYKGRDPILERDVAVKVLPPKLARSKEAVTRFLQEAKLASRLIHPNIVSIYDIGEESSGIPYIVMEYLDGETTLWDYMEKKDKPLEIEEGITLITPVCQALDYAHSQNIVHRDIKPENIMITRLNIVKVMDFGLACLEGVHNLTMAGEIFGTLTYFSPEQAQGLHADRRSDIYSVGVILNQMLTRKLPFEATSIPVLIKQHIEFVLQVRHSIIRKYQEA